jgi:hypothetical protein
MTDELTRFRADLPPADQDAMMKARAALVREATGGHRARVWWQVGITGVAVAAAAAGLFALPSATTKAKPASENGVIHNPDGSITIEFRELDDILGVNKELYYAGIRVVILDSVAGGVVECWTKYEVTPSMPPGAPDDVVAPRQNPWGDELTFWPNRIPADMWLYIQAQVESPGNEEVPQRCDPAQQWELSRNWVGDTAPGVPGLPPFPESTHPPGEQSTDMSPPAIQDYWPDQGATLESPGPTR